jgi:hypothetical protein
MFEAYIHFANFCELGMKEYCCSLRSWCNWLINFMFNEELPRYASIPYEIRNASRRKMLAWAPQSISEFKNRRKALIQIYRKIISLLKQSFGTTLLVNSQNIMFSLIAIWYVLPTKFWLSCTSHPPTHHKLISSSPSTSSWIKTCSVCPP